MAFLNQVSLLNRMPLLDRVSLDRAVVMAAAGAVLAAPLCLATSAPALAKHKKHHGAASTLKKPPLSQMKTTSPESKQTPSGGQPGGPAGKS